MCDFRPDKDKSNKKPRLVRCLLMLVTASVIMLGSIVALPDKARADFGDFAGDTDYGGGDDSGWGGGDDGGWDSDDHDGGGSDLLEKIFGKEAASFTVV